LLLIHEIAHAVSPNGHGEKWLRRIGKAALKAERLGRRILAELLRKEVCVYERSAEIRIEDLIEEWVMNRPDVPWESIEHKLITEYKMEKIRKRYKEAYKQAKRDFGV
jgi:hypothetical protein